MRTFNELKNVIVLAEDGSTIGKVEDVLVDASGTIQGFRIDQKKLFLRDYFLPISAPYQLEGSYMKISKHDLQPMTDRTRTLQSVGEHKGYIGKKIVTNDGDLQGIVQDVYFCFDLGKIEALEMSEGWFTDLVEGRKYVNCHDIATNGDQFLVLKNSGGGATHEMPKLFEQKPWEDRC